MLQLFNGKNNYEEFYKVDEFIEGNKDKNFFDTHQEGLLSIITLFDDLTVKNGKLGDFIFEIGSRGEFFREGLFKLGLSDELKNHISFFDINNEGGIYFSLNEGTPSINVTKIFNSNIEIIIRDITKHIFSKGNLYREDLDKFYKGSHSIGFEHFKVFLNGYNFDEELISLVDDIYDNHKSLTFSNLNELQKIIDLYNQINSLYLHYKFNFKQNEFDDSFNKIIGYIPSRLFYKYLDNLEESGIIKGYERTHEFFNSYPESKILTSIIVLDNGKIVKSYESTTKGGNICFLSVDEFNFETIDFLEKAYYYNRDLIITNTKTDVFNILLEDGVDFHDVDIEDNSHGTLLKLNFDTSYIENDISSYNNQIRHIVDINKDKILTRNNIKRDIKKIDVNNKPDIHKSSINEYIVHGKFNKNINDYIINHDLDRLKSGNDIYWDKYLYKYAYKNGSVKSIVDEFYVQDDLGNDIIKEIILLYVAEFTKDIDVSKNSLEDIKSLYIEMGDNVFGSFFSQYYLLPHFDIESRVNHAIGPELKKEFISRIKFRLDKDLWKSNKLEDLVEFKEFCKFFHLDVTKKIGNFTIVNMYVNTLNERKITEKEIEFIKENKIVVLNLYIDIVYKKLVTNNSNLDSFFESEILNKELTNSIFADLNQFLREQDIEKVKLLLDLGKKYNFGVESYLSINYFQNKTRNIDVLNLLKVNFNELYTTIITVEQKEKHLELSEKVEKINNKLSKITNTGYSEQLLRINDEGLKFLEDFLGKLNFDKINELTKSNRISFTEVSDKNFELKKIMGFSLDKGLEFLLQELIFSEYNNEISLLTSKYLSGMQDLIDGEIYDNLNSYITKNISSDNIGRGGVRVKS